MSAGIDTPRLEELVREVRSLENQHARDVALELVQSVMGLHASAIERMMELIHESECGGALLHRFAEESTVSGILLLHDLHPIEFETRVRRALEQPSLAVRGASVQIVSIDGAAVKLNAAGGPEFEARVRAAIMEAAPDAETIEIESASPIDAGFVPLDQLAAART